MLLFCLFFPETEVVFCFEEIKKCFIFKTQNPNSVVQRGIADVGQPPDLLATIVVTSTVHTAVISQKRENKILRRK